MVQAVVILAHFHALSSFIQGCGITPEVDFDKGHSYMDPGNFNSIRSLSEALRRSSGEIGSDQAEPPAPTPAATAPSVSFAMDQPQPQAAYFGSRILPSQSQGGDRKATKSILKKTEVGSSTPTAKSSTNSNNLLKDATHQNFSTHSPPKKGLGSGVSEVEIIMATMKNLSETSPIEE